MSLIAIETVRDAIKNDAALAAFWQTHYSKAAKHMIGYKRSANAADFPAVNLVPVTGLRNAQTGNKEVVSIVVGVNNPGITNEVFDGIRRVNEAGDLVLEAIKHCYVGDARVVTDLGERHPFYELEISVQLRYRKDGKLFNSIS